MRFPPLARARFGADALTDPDVGGCKREGPSSCCVLSVIIDSNNSSSPVDQHATLGSKVFDAVESCRRRRRRCYCCCCCCCSKLLLRGKGGDATGARRRTELWVRFRRLLGLSVSTLTNHLQLFTPADCNHFIYKNQDIGILQSAKMTETDSGGTPFMTPFQGLNLITATSDC